MTEREKAEAKIKEAFAARVGLQQYLDETEGWDDVPADAIEAFVHGEDVTPPAAGEDNA